MNLKDKIRDSISNLPEMLVDTMKESVSNIASDLKQTAVELGRVGQRDAVDAFGKAFPDSIGHSHASVGVEKPWSAEDALDREDQLASARDNRIDDKWKALLNDNLVPTEQEQVTSHGAKDKPKEMEM